MLLQQSVDLIRSPKVVVDLAATAHSRGTATRERRRSPNSPSTVITHNTTVTDGFPGQPIANRQSLRRPISTSPRLNGITSHTNHFTDTRHAIIGATQYYRLTDSLVHCRSYPVSKGVVPFRQEIHARALLLSRLDSTLKWSIALVELRHDEMMLPLRSAAGHTTKHGHIGT